MPNNKEYHDEGIAIIGVACYYPKSHGIDEFWNNIINRVYCINEIPKERWDPAVYYDPDKSAPDKTYSKIGGFVDDVDFKEITIKYKIPPKVINAMDRSQKFALLATGDALSDAGYMDKDFDRSRTAVIIGNSMGGDLIDYTNLRIFMQDVAKGLKNGSVFSTINPQLQSQIIDELMHKITDPITPVSEDTMPGELANVIAGRISNALNLTGPSFTVDAACASSLASLNEASKGLKCGDFDLAVAGGTDFLMGPGPYIKFSKIGALSGDGSMPFDSKANGFVMGEGTGIFILKRVSDARRDGDKIYAVITGVGSSADGKGKGITAPNPKGQTVAIERAFENAGYGPETIQYVEAHGTSTIVGDLAEMEGLLGAWGNKNIKSNSIGIGSIKSNIGHLKAASGSASIIKLALALHKKVMPPSINYETPNPKIDFGNIPFRVVTQAEEWPEGIDDNPRRGNASAFGFGGTNFHVTLEEDTGTNGMPVKKTYFTGTELNKGETQFMSQANNTGTGSVLIDYSHKRYELTEDNYKKLDGEAVVIGGSSWQDINDRLNSLQQTVTPASVGSLRDLVKRFNIESNSMDYRLGISSYSVEDFLSKFDAAREGFDNIKKRMVLKNKGLFYGEDLLEKKKSLAKVCVMFPGQGSQYANMLKDLYNKYNVVRDTFHEADEIMYDIIGRSLTEIIFLADDASKEEIANTENQLRQTEITQPGVLTANYAMFRLLKSFGIIPDVVVGHSLGEYGALIGAGVMTFKDALHAVSARGREISKVKWDDVGKMASVPATVEKAEQIIKGIPGYCIIANKNCHSQTVVAGDSPSIAEVLRRCEAEGIPAQEIRVSHAFHSKIVAPACDSYRKTIEKFDLKSPQIDISANLTGDYYPRGENVKDQIVDILVQHIASPVEFIKQIEKMYADGVNVFVEAGPKRTLTSFVLNILDKRPHLAMATNHPKKGGIGTLNDALAAMSTQGFDINWNGTDEYGTQHSDPEWRLRNKFLGKPDTIVTSAPSPAVKSEISVPDMPIKDYSGISVDGMFTDFQAKQKELVQDVINIYQQKSEELLKSQLRDALYYKTQAEKHNINFDKIMISGVSLGLPGERFKVFAEDGFDRLAQGINMIDPVPDRTREYMAGKNITRLLKKSDGEASFVTITDKKDVVKLCGRKGEFNFTGDYGFDQEYADKLEITTQLAIAAGIEALKDAGIPLVMNYKRTSTNKLLPAFWALPEDMQDDTGIIFAAAFPGENSVIEELNRALAYKYGSKSKKELMKLYTSLIEKIKDDKIREDLSEWYADNYSMLKDGMEDDVYKFNNKFIFKILVMGHSQLAELIKAKGPNIHINVACSSTTAGIGIAEDWIRTGRAKRVLVVSADDVTSDAFIEWILSGFLAVGAVTTQGRIEDAAIPFDRRRNGFIVGMGATGIVVEADSEIRKRGMEPIAEVAATEFLNSAFHGTRIDNDHVAMVMNRAVAKAEKHLGVSRDEMAKDMVFMSHETYTPARGGSASSEVKALRETFKDKYKDVIVSNTKGFTGHAMAVGVEDVVAVKCLQSGKIPPIANFREVDPELGEINLSNGGIHENIKYALRLGAGFGSQIAVSVLKLVSRKENRVVEEGVYKKWLADMSGIDTPEIEIVNRTLRVKDDGSIIRKDREKPAEVIPATPAPAAIAQSAAPQPVQQVPATPAPAASTIQKKILEIVGEKTGYPEDLIEFDLDMESDLGIDTVKQAEMFGLIRETFQISAEENIVIKDFPTLNHVVEFVKSKSPMKFDDAALAAPAPAVQTTPAQAAPASVPAAEAQPAGGGLNEIQKKIIAIVGEKTGYPEDLIEFDLDMESDLGIDTVKQAEMFGMIRETFRISA
ncbi:MAG: acyltransferase domain-containing protein, partial [Spirochaetes bacterium]|nr:acyltransferase domain-containing protein [Spirochaetota bacterium]